MAMGGRRSVETGGTTMRGRRVAASALVVAVLGQGAMAAAGPRHEAGWTDPTRSAGAMVWVQEDRGDIRHGSSVRIAPGPPGGPSRVPYSDFLPSVPDPDNSTLPSVEPPDSSAGMHLPDLVPLPASDVYAESSVISASAGDFVLATAQGNDPFAGAKKAIRFGTTITNAGRHSLEVIGLPTPTGEASDPVRVGASQCVRFAGPRLSGSARVCQEYRPVGSLVLHPQHGHFHIDGFAMYRLLKDAGGKPDRSPQGVVATSEKVGFCMGDTSWLGTKPLLVDTGWYRECRHTAPHIPVTFRQGISPQWGDTYGSDLAGQHLVVEKVPDGIYWIAITVNPGGPGAVKLLESNMANNTSYRRVQLSKQGTVAKML